MSPMIRRLVLVGALAIGGFAVYFNVRGAGSSLPSVDQAVAAPVAPVAAAAPASGPADPAHAPVTERYARLEQRLSENPRDVEALTEVAEILFKNKRYAEAADLLFQASEVESENARVHAGLGLSFFYLGLPTMAQAELARSIALDPNNALAQFNYGLLMSHGPRADLDLSRQSWEAVVRLEADSPLGRQARELLGQTAAKP